MSLIFRLHIIISTQRISPKTTSS